MFNSKKINRLEKHIEHLSGRIADLYDMIEDEINELYEYVEELEEQTYVAPKRKYSKKVTK